LIICHWPFVIAYLSSAKPRRGDCHPPGGNHAILSVRDDEDENFEDREQGSEVDESLGQPIEQRAFPSNAPEAGQKPAGGTPPDGPENP